MKKILSVLTALLMLVLPAVSCAGEAVFYPCAAVHSLAEKYLAEGQEMTADLSIVPGDLLLKLVPEQAVQAASDLMSVLGIRVRAQRTEGAVQFGLDAMLSGQKAAGFTAAMVDDVFYVTSNLLGKDIYAATKEELNQMAQSVSRESGIADMMTMMENMTSSHADAGMSAGDRAGVLSVLVTLGKNAETAEITEAPGEMPDAAQRTVITIKKEDAQALMQKAAGMIQDVPLPQQLVYAPGVKEKITAAADKLESDVIINVYTNESGDVLIQAAAKASGADIDAGLLLKSAAGEKEQRMSASGSVTVQDASGGGPLVLLISLESSEQDLQDHAAGSTVLRLGLEGEMLKKLIPDGEAGELLTIRCDAETALAEAYIADQKNAVYPARLSQEELAALTERIPLKIMSVALRLIKNLPVSVVELINTME